MYPTLYKANETNFAHNGFGFLRDAITVYPEEELNGYSEITIEYDADGFLANEIKNGMVIKAKANDKQQPQLFRIYSHVKDHAADQIVINGRHITNDLADNFVEELIIENMNTRQAMEAIQQNLAYPTRFNITSTNVTTLSSTKLYRNNPLQMVAGTDGSILDHWGGQIERDNFDLIMHRRRGSDDGVKVLYKKNLTGLQANFDEDNVVTRIYPFKYVEETEEEPARLITVPGKYIDSPNIDKYDHIKIQPIDASNEEGIENSTDLYNTYKDYFSDEGKDKDLPSVSMDVEFEHLHETEEYKDVAALEHVGMGDTITVGHSKWGLDLKATIVKIEYDTIAGKNRKVSAGNVKANFTDSVNKNADDLNYIGERVNQSEQKSNEAIRAANGKNTIYYGPDEPTGDHLIKNDVWFRIVDNEYTRTYIYDGVQWQLTIDADSKEAKETAAEARNQAQNAVDKADLATSNANDAIEKAQEGFDTAQQSMTRADSAFSKADALSTVVDKNTGDISSVTQIAKGLQTKVSDAEGNISTLQQTATSYGRRISDAEGNLSTLTQTAQGLQTRVGTAEGNVSTVTQLANTLQTDLRNAKGDINTLTQTASTLQSTIKGVQDNLSTADRNLISDSAGNSLNDWIPWASSGVSLTNYIGHDWIWVAKGNGDLAFGVHTPTFNLKANKTYICSLTIRSRSNSGYSLNYLYLRQGKNSLTSIKGLPNITMRDSSGFEGDIAGDGIRVWFNFSHNEDLEDARIMIAIRDRPDGSGFVIREIKVAEGDMLTPWSPAPDDTATQSQISQLSDNINLRVAKNDIINQINVSTESILISGKKLILDGDTTVNGSFKVDNANITALNAEKITTGTLDAGKANIININASNITTGRLDTRLVRIHGGTTTDYTTIEGSQLESRGRFTRTWRGKTKTHDIKLRFQDGYLRARNDSEEHSLYFSDFGISTFADGVGDGASGTIAFRDTEYSSASGVTIQSTSGVVALRSDENRIVIDSHQTVNLESNQASIYFRPMKQNRLGLNEFRLWVKDNNNAGLSDGVLSYGSGSNDLDYASGLRFKKSTSGDPIVYITNGNGDINSGKAQADSFIGMLEASGDTAYIGANTELRITSKAGHNNGNPAYRDVVAAHAIFRSIRLNTSITGTHFYFGVSNGELRIKSNLLAEGAYRPIRASEYLPPNSTRESKKKIELFKDNTLNTFRESNVYHFLYNWQDNDEKLRLGVMLDEVPDCIVASAGDTLEMYSTIGYLWKGQKDTISEIDLLKETIEKQAFKIADLEQRIHNLEVA